MSNISLDDVRKVAQLANLTFSEDELVEMQAHLAKTIGYVEILNQVDTENVAPMAHPIDVVDVFRDDVLTPMLSREEALQNAPKTDGQYFVVPAILDAGE